MKWNENYRHHLLDGLFHLGLEERIGEAVSGEDVVHLSAAALVDLVELITPNWKRRLFFDEAAGERLRPLDSRRVVQIQMADDSALIEQSAGTLVVIKASRFRYRQRHHHLHHFDLGVRLASLDFTKIQMTY